MNKEELKAVLPGGVHHEVAKAWLEDPSAEIQSRDCNEGSWFTWKSAAFIPEKQYRIKPKTLEFKVAVFKDDGETWTNTVEDKDLAKVWETYRNFVKWTTPNWQKVEV